MKDSSEAELFFNQGVQAFEARDFTTALEHLDRALESQPDYSDAWCCRGLVLGHLKRYPDSLTSFDRALELNPLELRAWCRWNWGRKWRRGGKCSVRPSAPRGCL